MHDDIIYCPADSIDCPYYGYDGRCRLEDPAANCDDYYAAVGDEDEDEDEAEAGE